MPSPFDILVGRAISGIISPPAVPPLNSPPVWDSQPSVVATLGSSKNIDMNDYVSDPDLDSLSFTMNTGTVALPTGWTWTAATGILAYDGTGSVGSSSGHIVTVSDGTDSTESSSFSIVISDTWPARWPQARGMYTISDFTNVLSTTQASWTYNSDLLIYQGVYPTDNNVETIANYIDAERTNYPSCKISSYTIPFWALDAADTSFSHRRLQRDAINNASAQDEWYLKHPTSGNYLYGSNDQKETIMTNVSDVCPLVGGETFITAYTALWFTDFANGANSSDVVALTDGVYFDSTDINNAFPQPVDGYLGADYDGVPDYNVDGSADSSQARYREGCVDLSNEFQSVATTSYSKSDWHISSNGGRDYAINVGTLSDYDWYQRLGHCRVMENADDRLRIVYNGSNGFTTQSGMADRVWDQVVRPALVSHSFLVPEATSGIRPYVLIDYPILMGGTGLSAGDLTNDAWILMESLWALCMLTEEMMYGALINKRQSTPDIDLYIVDTGSPLTTRSLGTLSGDGQTFTPRTPDSTEDGGEWYIEEFDNGFVWFNAADPSNSTAWPQAANNSTLSADFPTPPTGKKGQFINSATYTNTTYGLSAQGYASSRYDGSDATSITAGPYEGGWVHWVDV